MGRTDYVKDYEDIKIRILKTLVDINTELLAYNLGIKNDGFTINESALDSFGRLKTGSPESLFDAQFTYDLQPLVYEEIFTSNASITHDATNRMASISFTNAVNGNSAVLQTYEHFRYQPGKAQEITMTLNPGGIVADVTKFIGYCDGSNGVEFIVGPDGAGFRILSDTGEGDETRLQADWSEDKLDGEGPSGIRLDLNTTFIVYMDLQALYVGEVRVGFNIGGRTIIAHKFFHSNISTTPYIQTANLPLRAGMTTTTAETVTANMKYICASVISNGGQEDNLGYLFSTEGTVTAASGADTHILSIQPKTTFNSITNRTKLLLESVDIVVTGNQPVLWKLCIGQTLTSEVVTNVNATYSAISNVAGTLSGSPAIVLAQGYVPASAQTKSAISKAVALKYPITLTAAGAVRILGRLTVIVQGISGTSVTRCILNWKEIR